MFKTALAPDALTALPGRAGPTAAAVLETLDLEPLDTRFRVRAAANVRSAPDLTASRVTGLRGGEIVTALQRVSGQDWFLVERDGERLGFVFGALLEPAQSTSATSMPLPLSSATSHTSATFLKWITL